MFRNLTKVRTIRYQFRTTRFPIGSNLPKNSFQRFASNSPNSEIDIKLVQITNMIKNDPELQTTLLNLKRIFEENGVLGNGKPNLFKLSMLLMDKDVRTGIETFNQKIKDANIDIQPSDLSQLLQVYKDL